jgi:thiosulfate/3-mercaptopyruvate sulfurtransferase
MTTTFGRLGIGGDVQVVAYDQDSGMFASRLWWMLRYAGHDNVAVLDGGWAKWIAESGRRAAAAKCATRRPSRRGGDRTGTSTSTLSPPSTRNPDTLLLDARAPERFEGRVEPLDRLPGHIPGAANHPYRSNLAADNTMLPAGTLREQFIRDLGGRAPAQTVMYCGSGVTACQNLLAMEHAGLPGARLYVGSWSEWSAEPARPVETGPSRR